jgi:hypothetical protein
MIPNLNFENENKIPEIQNNVHEQNMKNISSNP